jgi:GNAT superfamily N-acetyltransferase
LAEVQALEVPRSTFECRELRRRDLPTFGGVILQGMGAFEAATKIDVTTTESVKNLRRPGMVGLVRLLQLLQIAQVRILVAVDRGQVVGTTVVSFLPSTGYIGGVATDAAARGRGIATRLMELAHTFTRGKQKPWLSLDVESGNETAIRLYRRLGYTVAGRYDWFIGPTPKSLSPGGPVPVEIRTADKDAREWANQTQPAAVRGPLPSTSRRLTHLELFSRPPRATPKTWKLTSERRTVGVVRGYYGSKTTTGFVFPVGTDPSISESTCAALVAPAINWQQTQGATRIIIPVLEPSVGWTSLAASLGLERLVSTSLMVRPTAP